MLEQGPLNFTISRHASRVDSGGAVRAWTSECPELALSWRFELSAHRFAVEGKADPRERIFGSARAVLFAAAAAHAAGSCRKHGERLNRRDGCAAPSIGPALIGSRRCGIGSISQARIFTRAASASRRWRCSGGRWIGELR